MKSTVIVIGAGAAGLLAAGKAATDGARVILLEKMKQPGRKLRITGKGRCNLTNIAELRDFVDHFGKGGRFLRQAFSRFFSPDLLALLEEMGVETITERGGRVFPVNEKATEVVEALIQWNKRLGVQTKTGVSVNGLRVEDNRVVGVKTGNNEIEANAVIIATGGVSYPGTGSTGDGYRLAKSVGHTISPVRPALVPLETAGDVAQRLQGLSLRNVSVSVWIDGKKAGAAAGEMLFTHFGLSGPIILTLSRGIVEVLGDGRKVIVSLDLKPALDDRKLDARLLRDFAAHPKRQFENLLVDLLPRKLIPVCMDLTGIPADRPGNQITSDDRKKLRLWLKDFRFDITGHRSWDEAIITAGGVNTKEVKPKTLESKLIGGLYFAGEVLDIDADTGGYNLQAAFSTGWLAGQAAAAARRH